MSKKLSQFNIGESGRIVSVNSEALKLALLGLGLAQGVHFTLTNRAPMGDPIAVRISGTKVAIRKAQAELITAEPDA